MICDESKFFVPAQDDKEVSSYFKTFVEALNMLDKDEASNFINIFSHWQPPKKAHKTFSLVHLGF